MITTLVGSYPKVAQGAYGTKVIGALNRWQRQEYNDAQLESVFQDVTQEVIKEQEDAGIDLLSHGQIRWEDLVSPIAKHLKGFEINGLTRWFDNNVYYRRPILHKAPKREGPILVKEYRHAASCTKKPVKAILPGPYTFVSMSEDRYYKNEKKFVLKMAEILNQEARALAAAGAPFIQFDEPALGFGKPNLKLAAEAINVAVKGLKSKTAVYVYFGSLNGAFSALMKTNVDVVGIDIISEPKTLAALKRTKISKEIALGCIDGRNTKLESETELHALFNHVRKLISLDRLYINPSCGLEFLPHAQALDKVQLLSQAVRSYRS